jgi:hypothetical protein
LDRAANRRPATAFGAIRLEAVSIIIVGEFFSLGGERGVTMVTLGNEDIMIMVLIATAL